MAAGMKTWRDLQREATEALRAFARNRDNANGTDAMRRAQHLIAAARAASPS